MTAEINKIIEQCVAEMLPIVGAYESAYANISALAHNRICGEYGPTMSYVQVGDQLNKMVAAGIFTNPSSPIHCSCGQAMTEIHTASCYCLHDPKFKGLGNTVTAECIFKPTCQWKGTEVRTPAAAATVDTKEVLMAGGLASSSECPDYSLIPQITLDRLANQFTRGVRRKKEKAWNAKSGNQTVLTDREFAIERLNHVIRHAKSLQERLHQRVGKDGAPIRYVDDADDAAAILWGGSFLCSVTEALDREAGEAGEEKK